MTFTAFSAEACMDYRFELPESSCAKSGRDSTTCCPKCFDVFPTANRQPLPPYMGRVEHPCSTAADQGWSALPRQETSYATHKGDSPQEGLCPESSPRYLDQVAHRVIIKHLPTRATWPYFIFSSLRVCWTQSHAPADPRGLRPAGFLILGIQMSMPPRVAILIDGFNLYHSLQGDTVLTERTQVPF